MATTIILPAADVEPNTIVTQSANTDWIDTANLGEFQIVFSVSAADGNAAHTLDWKVYQSYNGLDSGSDNTNIAGTFTQVTGTTTMPNIQVKNFSPVSGAVLTWSRYIRIVRTLSSGAQFTTSNTVKSLTYKA